MKIIHSDNPYKMDYIANENKMPALTRKNADFIEAVIHLDSNYAKNLEITPPSEGYDPEINVESSNGKYCGSTAYWFETMKNSNCSFKKCVLGAIIAIDTTNSTHLEVAIMGRKSMRDIICKYCNDYEDLIDMLNVPFSANNHMHLISLLTRKTIAKKDGNARYNISFATKFCAYAAIFLDSQVKYSKYDNIVSNALPRYCKIYLDEKRNAREFKINEYQRKLLDDDGNYQYRLDVYEKYQHTITEILNKLKLDGVYLSREEFDHIIWYGLKG